MAAEVVFVAHVDEADKFGIVCNLCEGLGEDFPDLLPLSIQGPVPRPAHVLKLLMVVASPVVLEAHVDEEADLLPGLEVEVVAVAPDVGDAQRVGQLFAFKRRCGERGRPAHSSCACAPQALGMEEGESQYEVALSRVAHHVDPLRQADAKLCVQEVQGEGDEPVDLVVQVSVLVVGLERPGIQFEVSEIV